MPELPEVETVRLGLDRDVTGQTIARVVVRRPDLRTPFPPDFAMRLEGRTLVEMNRRGKYLLMQLDDGFVLLVHLGMSGRISLAGKGPDKPRATGEFYHTAASPGGAHDHVEFLFTSGLRLTYSDPRRFGLMDLIAPGGTDAHPLLRDMGVEPLGNRFNAAFLAGQFRKRRTSLKAALLDQKIVAGLGNIYVSEALWRAHLSPLALASSLVPATGEPDARLEDLVTAIRAVLTEAIAAGGSSLRDYAQADGTRGDFQNRFAVYDREGQACLTPGCSGKISRIVQSGRSTFYCPTCQK